MRNDKDDATSWPSTLHWYICLCNSRVHTTPLKHDTQHGICFDIGQACHVAWMLVLVADDFSVTQCEPSLPPFVALLPLPLDGPQCSSNLSIASVQSCGSSSGLAASLQVSPLLVTNFPSNLPQVKGGFFEVFTVDVLVGHGLSVMSIVASYFVPNLECNLDNNKKKYKSYATWELL
ncbi:hypothetical protein HD554DRAFT_2038972 [Boletus coccyginus]|nr:hypothetical protein HD554DRAFT_2042118 [Boletus coccyginus]KAI9568145.1 hypothetical protein HD554DRAFT_2038972 [Boletus coccyginus]